VKHQHRPELRRKINNNVETIRMDPVSKTELQSRRPAMLRATVARGRSIEVPTEERFQTGYDKDGKPAHALKCVTYVEGQELDLPEDEVVRLRGLGFLTDPNAKPFPPDAGAGVREQVSGPQVLSPVRP
jgi:hypothetical protein